MYSSFVQNEEKMSLAGLFLGKRTLSPSGKSKKRKDIFSTRELVAVTNGEWSYNLQRLSYGDVVNTKDNFEPSEQ